VRATCIGVVYLKLNWEGLGKWNVPRLLYFSCLLFFSSNFAHRASLPLKLRSAQQPTNTRFLLRDFSDSFIAPALSLLTEHRSVGAATYPALFFDLSFSRLIAAIGRPLNFGSKPRHRHAA